MTDEQPAGVPAEATGVPGETAAVPPEAAGVPGVGADLSAEVVEAARVRLAEWLTAEAPSPEYGATPEDLAEWAVRPEGEFLVFIPPGYANQLFLVAEHGISSFAPSLQTLDDAIAAARNQS